MLPFDLVVFDLDGTLADTAQDLTAALNAVLRELGRAQLPEARVRTMIGHGARALVRKGLAATGVVTDQIVEQAFARFLAIYGEAICTETRPFEGAADMLDDLAARGVKTALCTNKPEALTHDLLAGLGWSDRFAAVVGGDTLPVRKPDPGPLREAITRAGGRRPVFVGDSLTDADTARAAGVPFVAATFGYCEGPVEALGADAIVTRFGDLLPALRTLGSASST